MARNGIFFALENEEVLDPAPIEEVVPAADLEVQENVAEATQDVAEVEDVNAAVEEAVEGAEELEAIQDVAEATVETGEGMAPEAAQVAEIAVEAICARLGLRTKTKMVPAVESFGSKNSRLAATKIAVESINEQLVKIWNQIKATIAAVVEKIKDMVFKMLNGVGSLEKSIKAAQEAVAKLEGEAAEKEFASQSLAGAIGGNAASAEKVLDSQTKMIGSYAAVQEAFKKTADACEPVAKDFTKELPDFGLEAFPGFKFEGLFGGKSAGFAVAEGKVKFTSTDGAAPEKDAKVAVLTKDEMSKVLTSAGDLVKAFGELKSKVSAFDKASAAAKSVADAVVANVKKMTSEKEVAEKIKALRNVVTSASSANASFNSFVAITSLRAAKTGVDYVNASMKQYKKAEAKAE